MKYSIVLTTTATKEDARGIATALLEQKLAACVQLKEIESLYSWEGKIQNANEVLLLIKAQKDNYAKIELLIKENHKYETPEVVVIPIENGSPEYLRWIDEVTV